MGNLLISSHSQDPFMDRREAGEILGNHLLSSVDDTTVVLGIPRGGVIVAREVARVLGADLDVVLSRKLNAPDSPDLAIGALGEDGRLFLDAGLCMRMGADEAYIEQEKISQMSVIRHQARQYRKIKPKVELQGRVVIITDDGAVTGSTMQAAIWTARGERPARLIAAVPVGAMDALMSLSDDADEVFALKAPSVLESIGRHYVRFGQVADEEVLEALRVSAQGSA